MALTLVQSNDACVGVVEIDLFILSLCVNDVSNVKIDLKTRSGNVSIK